MNEQQRTPANRGDLFEELRQCVGCEFVSDMRSGAERREALRAAAELNVTDYPLSQWKDLARYLHLKRAKFDDYTSVRLYFNKKVTRRICFLVGAA